MALSRSVEEGSIGTETIRGELMSTWNNVARRIVARRGAVAETLHREQTTANSTSENVPSTDPNRPSDVNWNTDVTGRELSLPNNSYFGYTYTFAILLALISLIFICLSFYSVYRSLRDPGKNQYGLTILPSFLLFSGKCEHLAWVSGGLHLIVNVLGSIIFGISTYLQQLCTSPTLHDIQKEIRQEGGDVRFGSILPLGLVRRHKKGLLFVWFLLLVTSLPIHLALNGALGYVYNAYQLTGRVIRDDDLDTLTEVELSWTKATGGDCFRFRSQYGLDIEVSNITLIVNASGSTDIQDYLLKEGNADSRYNANLSFIEYCYENKTIPECGVTVRYGPLLLFSSAIAIKAVVAVLAMRSFTRFSQPIYNSLGDILDLSVTQAEIVIPKGEYLLDSRWTLGERPPKKSSSGAIYIKARNRKLGWWQLMSAMDWFFYAFLLGSLCGLIMAVFDSTVVYFPLYSTKNMLRVWLSAGFGTPFRLLWTFTGFALNGELTSSQLSLLVLISNLPQLWLSMAILVITDHITRIWLEREWRSYYIRPKQPRVSWDNENPRRYVRKPRILQAPYSVTVGLIIMGAVGHWITSESFFVVEISAKINRDTSFMNMNTENSHQALIFYLTHSPGPMALGALLGSLVLGCLTIHLLIPHRTCMPVMNGSVRVVLASCTRLTHFPAGGIAWGDVSESDAERVAGFSGLVRPLSFGMEYPKQSMENAKESDSAEQGNHTNQTILYQDTGWRMQQ